VPATYAGPYSNWSPISRMVQWPTITGLLRDLYNDMHTALSGGYKGLTGDAATS
jgi:hypothetical protein